MYGGQNTYIPLKVNQSGVVPIIFASSVLLLPVLITNFLGGSMAPDGWRRSRSWVERQPRQQPQNLIYIVAVLAADHRLRLLLQLDRLRPDPPGRSDPSPRRFHPGCAARPQTERYLAKAVNRITLPGAMFVAVIAITPYIILWMFDVQNFPFAGTTVLIAVGVALELMRQIDSQLMLRNYEGFLK